MYHINSTEYERNFWNAVKRKNPAYTGLSQGRHSMTNSYALPSEQNKQFIKAMENENAFRSLATVVNAPGSDRTLFTCDAEDIATWLGDGSLDTHYDGIDNFKKSPTSDLMKRVLKSVVCDSGDQGLLGSPEFLTRCSFL